MAKKKAAANKTLKITLVKSPIGYTQNQRVTAETLGLRKINDTTTRELTEVVEGQLRLVNHLVRVEEVKD